MKTEEPEFKPRKSKDTCEVLLSDINLIREYYNALIITHSQSTPEVKHKLNGEMSRVRGFLSEWKR